VTMKIPSSGMWRRLTLEIKDVSYSSETYFLTRATRRHIPEDGILRVSVSVLR
jgi:hypothetical protein